MNKLLSITMSVILLLVSIISPVPAVVAQEGNQAPDISVTPTPQEVPTEPLESTTSIYLPLISGVTAQNLQETISASTAVLGEEPDVNLNEKTDGTQDDVSQGKVPPEPGFEPPVLESTDIKTIIPEDETFIAPSAVDGWTTLMNEGFEGAFPNSSWRVLDSDGSTNGQYYWDDTSYLSASGSWSAWAARGGPNGLDPRSYNYANNMRSWMIYGPFDLSNVSDAELLFSYWNRSEANYDYFGWYASINGTNFFGNRVSGDSSGWRNINFDLTAVPTLGNLIGKSSVWIAFYFQSDGSITNKGPFVDNITLQKMVNTPLTCPNQYKVEYFNNKTLSGSPTVVRCENWPINYNWESGSPVSGVGSDNFSVRWTGTANISAGTYKFRATADDGIRVWLDNSLIIDAWRDQGATTYETNKSVSSGNHNLKVEYYENTGGAVAQFAWSPVADTCSNQYKAEYFNNKTLSGSPTVTRCESAPINYNWESGNPVSGVGSDNFSVRWTGSISINAGTYTFLAAADDGIRVWLDDLLLIDAWVDQGPTAYRANRTVSSGYHSIKIEYYESGSGAVAQFSWSPTVANGVPGITYSTRDGFNVFKIDMWSANLSFETVMANDVRDGDTINRETVSSMANRYNARNPVLAFNTDYSGNNRDGTPHHGAEGLIVKNGTRLNNAGTHNGTEWQRSSLSIPIWKVVRIGKQTDCVGTPQNPSVCAISNWVPDSNAYYNTVGGGPLFIENGQRIRGEVNSIDVGGLKPCRVEAFEDRYCNGSFRWTAAGTSADGRYLIVIVSDIDKSMDQAASVLIAEGAWRAMKFDSGHMTQAWYKPKGFFVKGRPDTTGAPIAMLVFSAQ